MNLRRSAHLFFSSLTRVVHRHGLGVQSPWAYALIRDVLFAQLSYYASTDLHLTTPLERQLYRIRNHFSRQPLIIIDDKGEASLLLYEELMTHVSPDTILVVEHTHNENANLWNHIVADPRAIITFDMGHRGLVTFDPKRIKQNYLL